MEKVDYKAIIKRMYALCWIFLLATFALKLFGVDLFVAEINNERILSMINFVDNSHFLETTMNVIITLVSFNLMYASVMKGYKEHINALNIIILIYSIVISLFSTVGYKSIISNAIPIIIYFVPYIFERKISSCIKIMVLDILFALTSAFVLNLNINTYEDSTLLATVFAVDYVIMWAIYFLKSLGGERKWHGYSDSVAVFAQNLKQKFKSVLASIKVYLTTAMIKTKNFICNANFNKLKTYLKMYSKYDLKDDIKDKFIPLASVFILCLAFAYLLGMVLEAILLYIAYMAIRKLFPKHFHADYIPNIKSRWVSIICMILTTLIICTGIYLISGIRFSMFGVIIVAFIIDFVLYSFRDLLDLKAKYDTDFTKYGFSIETANFAYDWKVNGLHDKELIIKYKLNCKSTLDSRKRFIKSKITQYNN